MGYLRLIAFLCGTSVLACGETGGGAKSPASSVAGSGAGGDQSAGGGQGAGPGMMGGSGPAGAGTGGAGGSAGTSGAGRGGTSGSGGGSGKAGSSGSAGSSDMPPPVKVNDCSMLPKSGVWEAITPPLNDGANVQTIQVDPLNAGVLYTQVHTGGNGTHAATDGLRVSKDCGATWAVVPAGRNANDDSGDSNINKGSWTSLLVDPVDSTIMYTVSNYGPGGVWRSTNGGTDWDQVVTDDVGKYVNGLWFNALSMDPTNHKHLIAVNHDGCNGAYDPNCYAETRDGGTTWQLVKLPVPWQEANGTYIIDDQTIIFGTGESGLFVTKNGGADWTKAFDGASGAGLGTQAYKASDGNYYLPSVYGILRSSAKDLLSWTNVQSGQFEQLVGTGKNLLAANYFAPTFWTASDSAPSTWTQYASPKAAGANASQSATSGSLYMVYDDHHHVLYASNYYQLFRTVLE